jgi:FKBP-type peptidyl-prolyl cis-trans isomerase (trigger factor)
MEAEQKQKNQQDLENQIIEQLVKENTFPLPQSLIDKQAELLTNRQKDRLLQQGVAGADQTKLLDGMKADIQK